jgi:hypothetical protein
MLQYFSGFAFLTRNRVWGKGYWVWVKGFFFPFSVSPFPLNREVLEYVVLFDTLKLNFPNTLSCNPPPTR